MVIMVLAFDRDDQHEPPSIYTTWNMEKAVTVYESYDPKIWFRYLMVSEKHDPLPWLTDLVPTK